MSARSRRFPWWGPRRPAPPEPEPGPVNLPVYEDPWTGFRGAYAGNLFGRPVFHVQAFSPPSRDEDDDG